MPDEKSNRPVSPSQLSPRGVSTSTTGASAAESSPDCGNPLKRFKGQIQSEDEWCWAAVCAAIAGFYGNTKYTKQCQIVGDYIGQPCCTNLTPACKNKTVGGLDPVLIETENYNNDLWATGPAPSFNSIKAEIDNCHPLGLSFTWTSGPDKDTGHAVSIIGYTTSPSNSLIIYDPANDGTGGQHTVPYPGFFTAYKPGTTSYTISWITLCKTKKQ
jgi:hypothetical protein